MRPTQILIELKYKVGKDDNTEFTIFSLPAEVKKSARVCSLLSILVTRGSRCPILGFVKEKLQHDN
jgi:hypothetical protein